MKKICSSCQDQKQLSEFYSDRQKRDGFSPHCKSCNKDRYLKRTDGIKRLHYQSKSPTYRRWQYMKARCLIPSATGYKNYGGRGIKICKRWRNSYFNFLTDMVELPSSDHSIERINNNGNYEPSNCRWAIKQVQVNNTRANVKFNYKGEMLTLMAISEITGVNYATLRWRMLRGKTKYNSVTEALGGASC